MTDYIFERELLAYSEFALRNHTLAHGSSGAYEAFTIAERIFNSLYRCIDFILWYERECVDYDLDPHIILETTEDLLHEASCFINSCLLRYIHIVKSNNSLEDIVNNLLLTLEAITRPFIILYQEFTKVFSSRYGEIAFEHENEYDRTISNVEELLPLIREPISEERKNEMRDRF